MLSKRERLARIAGNVWSASLLQQLFRGPSLVCLTHHRVADRVDHDPDVISATPAQLLGQAEWLKASYPILDGEQVKRFVCGELSLRQPSIALTFDDAYEDNFEVGRILMERFGIPAMFFVPTAFIETGLIPVWDRLGFAVRHSKTSQFVIPRMGQHGPWSVDAAQYGATISRLMGAYSGLPRDLQLAFVESCESAAGCSANDEGRRSPFMTWNQIQEVEHDGTHDRRSYPYPSRARIAAHPSATGGDRELTADPRGAPGHSGDTICLPVRQTEPKLHGRDERDRSRSRIHCGLRVRWRFQSSRRDRSIRDQAHEGRYRDIDLHVSRSGQQSRMAAGLSGGGRTACSGSII